MEWMKTKKLSFFLKDAASDLGLFGCNILMQLFECWSEKIYNLAKHHLSVLLLLQPIIFELVIVVKTPFWNLQ